LAEADARAAGALAQSAVAGALAQSAAAGALAQSAVAGALAQSAAAGALAGSARAVSDLAQAETGGAGSAWGRTAAGGPVLLDAVGWHVSISYGGDWVAVAGAGFPVGIDIEPAGRAAPRELLRRLAPQERAWIEQADGPAESDQRFLVVWTMKESYLKWRGSGIAGGLGAFNVLEPAALGARFGPVGAAAGLVGHVCAALGRPFDLAESGACEADQPDRAGPAP
jgi:hypothetical protein